MKRNAWSYTALTAFETCPKRYYLTRVSKEVKEGATEATTWGNCVHKALELRVKDKTPLPAGMEKFEAIAAKFDNISGEVSTETKFTLDEHMKVTDWFSKDAWLRCIFDLTIDKGVTAAVLDYKTGKRKVDSKQLQLFAGVMMGVKPELEVVKTGFIWLKENKTDTQTFTRKDLPDIWGEFLPRVDRLDHAFAYNKWEAKPSGLCREWCPVGKSRCTHCGKV